MTVAIPNDPDSKLASVAELVLPLHAGPERSVPASKTYTASLLALALISQAIDRDEAFGSALERVPSSMAGALKAEADPNPLAPPPAGARPLLPRHSFQSSPAQ